MRENTRATLSNLLSKEQTRILAREDTPARQTNGGHGHGEDSGGQDQGSPELTSSIHPSSIPIQILPVELLAHIFAFCAVSESHVNAYPALLIVTYVCHDWRTIALGLSQLWTSITPNMPLQWIKVFVERSRTLLMDFDLRLFPSKRSQASPYPENRLHQEDVILLLKDFERVRSLCLRGCSLPINHILNSLRHMIPIQSLSLLIDGYAADLVLPDDLFGGNAPIRCLHFKADSQLLVPPGGLLHGVTHFTCKMSSLPLDLLNILCQMSALTYFEFWPLRLGWPSWFEMGDLPTSPIHMPNLRNLVVHSNTPAAFMLLNRLLLMHVDVKRRMELYLSPYLESVVQSLVEHPIDSLSLIVEAANGFKHVHVSGTRMGGWCRLWTGDAATEWEDARFCLSFQWSVFHRECLDHFITIFGPLGMARARRLVIDSPDPGLPKSTWWKLLATLPGIEELELYSASVDTLDAAWKLDAAPAVLPALRSIQVKDSELAPPRQYTIIGNPPARTIVHLPSSIEGDVGPFPEMVSAEKELENMSQSLLKLLRGLGWKEPRRGSRRSERLRQRG